MSSSISERICVSKGNRKLGKVPNLSLPPGITCYPGAPCLTEGCYAMKAYRQYANVRQAWQRNLRVWESSPHLFTVQLSEWLQKHKPELFRWHVGGDIPDPTYYEKMRLLAHMFSDIKFLCFTKRLEFVAEHIPPRNLRLFISVWHTPRPGLPKLPTGVSYAFMDDYTGEDFSSHNLQICQGSCDSCDHLCWYSDKDVLFKKH